MINHIRPRHQARPQDAMSCLLVDAVLAFIILAAFVAAAVFIPA